METLIKFAELVGAQVELKIEEQTTASHPQSSELQADYRSGNVKRSGAAIDDDWTIPNLEKVLKKRSVELSRTIWKTAQTLEANQLEARFRPNLQFDPKRAPSSIVVTLKKMKWIPQKDGTFVRPADASRDQLPKGFAFDSGWEWLKAIGFEENIASRSEERRAKQAVAKQLGFSSVEQLERALIFAKFPRDEQERILADHKDQSGSKSDNNADASGGRKNRSKSITSDSGNEGSKTDTDTKGKEESSLGKAKRTAAPSRRRQFISYIAAHPDDEEPNPEGLDHETRKNLEEKAIRRILEEEPGLQRTSVNNPGFDLYEEGPNGERTRWVEVKAMRGSLEDHPVGMSHTQFNCAREHGSNYWLYIVEYANDDNEYRILPIQDPAGKAKTFTFDCGWVDAAEIDGV